MLTPAYHSVNRCIPLHCEGLQVEWSFKIPCSFSAESCDRCYQWPFLVVSYLLLLFCRMERTKNVHRKLSRARNQPNKMAVNKQRREVRSISTFLWLWHEATGGIAFCFPLDRMLVYCLAHPCPENFIGFPDSSPVFKL